MAKSKSKSKKETKSAEELFKIVSQLNDLVTKSLEVREIDLMDIPREDGDESNGDILDEMTDNDRDFVSLTDREFEAALAMFDELISDIVKKTKVTTKPKVQKMRVYKALKSIMRFWADTISMHIVRGISATGSLQDLSDGYREWKQKRYGNAYPIGVATRQLLRNLKVGAIRLRR